MSPWVKKFLFSKDTPEQADEAASDLNATLKALGQTANNVIHVVHKFTKSRGVEEKERHWWELWVHTWQDDDSGNYPEEE